MLLSETQRNAYEAIYHARQNRWKFKNSGVLMNVNDFWCENYVLKKLNPKLKKFVINMYDWNVTASWVGPYNKRNGFAVEHALGQNGFRHWRKWIG